MATAAKFHLPIAILLAYLIQLEVDVTGNITAKLCEVGSEFNIFCTLVTMATAAILNVFNPQKLPHTTVDIPTKFHEVWWKESKIILNSPFFVSMATAAEFVQPIPILAYLVPLAVDVVPIKFHQSPRNRADKNVWKNNNNKKKRSKNNKSLPNKLNAL